MHEFCPRDFLVLDISGTPVRVRKPPGLSSMGGGCWWPRLHPKGGNDAQLVGEIARDAGLLRSCFHIASEALSHGSKTFAGFKILFWFRGLLVGAAGFEPTTPSPPDWCANRAAPRPDRNGRDYRDAPIAAQPSAWRLSGTACAPWKRHRGRRLPDKRGCSRQ